jgi:hypothetical protein
MVQMSTVEMQIANRARKYRDYVYGKFSTGGLWMARSSITAFHKQNRKWRNRMRKSRSYGSVGERGGNEPLYPDANKGN